MNRLSLFLLGGLVGCLALAGGVQAQVPQLINYQGVLTNPASGNPVPDGTYSIGFSIYSVASGGTALWTETQSVTTIGGRFNVLLGSVNVIAYTVFGGGDRYLGVRVGTDSEMSPRKSIASVGYAFMARDADKVDGQDASAFAPAAHDHDSRYFTESELYTNDGMVNESGDPVSWYKIRDMPAGFADGTDNVGAAGGIYQINGGTGMTVTNPTGPTTTLGLSMGHGNGIDADMVDGKHAGGFAVATHNHLGETWAWGSNTGTALDLVGAVPWSNGVLLVRNTGNGPSIWGRNFGGGNAVRGDGYGASIGVYGEGDSGPGVAGRSATGNGLEGFAAVASKAGVYGQNTAGDGVMGEASASNNSGVHGINTGSGYGVTGSSVNSTGVYAAGGGGGRNLAALRVNNTKTGDGMAAYLTNSSGFHTAHFFNDGTGGVLYLQNGVTDLTAGGDFITAVDRPENDVQFRVTSTGQARSDVGFTTPAEDFAEMLPAVPGLEPGDVLVIGPDGKLTGSTEPYQTSVAGVYSTQPGFVGGMPVDGGIAGTIPLAVVGIVPVKVTAENGAIRPGDLLVASSAPGHAMKAGLNPPQGSVIGKALDRFEQGTGAIKMLVTLQ